MKRPRQSAVRQNAGPLALFSFVVNVTASFFRQFSRHISTWEKELNRRRQTLKPLENQGFFRLSLLYRNGIPSQRWHCKMAWTSKPSAVCSATMMPDSHSAPTPTPLGRCSKRLWRKWAVSWLRFDKSHRQAEHRKGNGFLSGALWLFPHSSLCGSRCGSGRCFKTVIFEKRRRKMPSA